SGERGAVQHGGERDAADGRGGGRGENFCADEGGVWYGSAFAGGRGVVHGYGDGAVDFGDGGDDLGERGIQFGRRQRGVDVVDGRDFGDGGDYGAEPDADLDHGDQPDREQSGGAPGCGGDGD